MELTGRGLAEGTVEAKALVSRSPISFLGGLDPNEGTIADPDSDILGQSVRGKALIFPRGKGSTVGSYVLYAAAKRGNGPAALVCDQAETIVTVGAVIAGIPLVDALDTYALESGDRVTVDGGAGSVVAPQVQALPVASAFLRRGDRFLFLMKKWRTIM